MATIATMVVNVEGRTAQLVRSLRTGSREVQTFAMRAQVASRTVVSSFGGIISKVAALAGAYGALRVAGRSLELAGEFEKTSIAFEVMLGSAEKAKTLLSDITEFSASTPFEFNEVVDASRKLFAFGIAQEKIIPTLKRIGDISAGISQPVGEIAEIYGKARVQGRLFAEDINQLTGRGIPIIQELAKQFGVAEGEVRKLVESGKVSFDNLEKAFVSLTGNGGKFANLMQRQTDTVLGQFSNLKDQITLTMQAIGAEISKALNLKDVLAATAEQFGTMRASAENMGSAITGIAERIALAFTAVLDVIHTLSLGFEFMQGAMITAFQRIVEYAAKFVDILTAVGRWMGAQGQESGLADDLRAFAKSLEMSAERQYKEFYDSLIGKSPSERIRKFFDDLRNRDQNAVPLSDENGNPTTAAAAVTPKKSSKKDGFPGAFERGSVDALSAANRGRMGNSPMDRMAKANEAILKENRGLRRIADRQLRVSESIDKKLTEVELV